jgi:low temperature requirement protein LtrA
VFGQMGILALLAVFTADAAGRTGGPFALVYAAFLAALTFLWYSVRHQDRAARPELLPATGRYVAGMSASVTAIVASAFLPPDGRLAVWAGFALVWVAGIAFVARSRAGLGDIVRPTHSLVERFGLFIIIVLGEVVFGVVNGLSAAEQDLETIATGLIALGVGFGLWWIYFDLVGGRLPRSHGRPLSRWLLSHLPVTMAIAASGAAMVSLIDHAHDDRTPVETGWLLAGAVAVALLATVVIARALVDAERLAVVYRPVVGAVVFGALASLGVGLLDPPPWLFALLLAAVLLAIWVFAVGRFLQVDAWQWESEHAHEASYP